MNLNKGLVSLFIGATPALLFFLLVSSLALKIALLLTSQSMADGDESVEGIMAIHILKYGVHPIYPYGVHYGAGTFIETHLAALLFKLFGISDITLKMSGLILWICSLFVLFAIAKNRFGLTVGIIAALLFSFSPQSAMISLKVAGGHQVAILLCLLCFYFIEKRSTILVACLLPLAAFAHPIVIPFSLFGAIYMIFQQKGKDRIKFISSFIIATTIVSFVLWPSGQSVWNPKATTWDFLAIATTLPGLLLSFFAPNLNLRESPESLQLIVSLIWLVAFACAIVKAKKCRPIFYAFAAASCVIFTVAPEQLAPRHLLLLYPLSCLILASGISLYKKPLGSLIILVLILSGGIVQVSEMFSPYIYGPNPQHRGISRNEIRNIIKTLNDHEIKHVYCLDPMLQWNIIFQSREKILARWFGPIDRVPEYPARVDQARLSGKPVALVGEFKKTKKRGPQSFEIILNPDLEKIQKLFPLSPYLSKETKQP